MQISYLDSNFTYFWLKVAENTVIIFLLISIFTMGQKIDFSVKIFFLKKRSSSLIFYKDVSALFMLSELQPCVISIRLKFGQRKQSRYVFIKNKWRVTFVKKFKMSYKKSVKMTKTYQIQEKITIKIHFWKKKCWPKNQISGP